MDLSKIIQQIGPAAMLAIIEAILQLDETQLKQLVQALQQAVQQQGGQAPTSGPQPAGMEQESSMSGQQNLFG